MQQAWNEGTMTKNRPTSRVLALLELLQSHNLLPGAELADRIGVDLRTIRRYVAHLVELGVPIQTQRGRDGGYGLTAGHRLPPMMFTEDEAMALAIGLRAAKELGLHGILSAISSTQAKLERVMPSAVRRRIEDANTVIALELPRVKKAAVQQEVLALSAAARAQQRVHMVYQSAANVQTQRDVDVYGLGFRGGAWYAVGFCHLRSDVRSFRVDRVCSVEALPSTFQRPDGFDVLDYLTRSIATLPRNHSVQVILLTDLATARAAIYGEMGLLEPIAQGVRLVAQVDDLHAMARDLARLPFPFKVSKPAALRRALALHAKALLV